MTLYIWCIVRTPFRSNHLSIHMHELYTFLPPLQSARCSTPLLSCYHNVTRPLFGAHACNKRQMNGNTIANALIGNFMHCIIAPITVDIFVGICNENRSALHLHKGKSTIHIIVLWCSSTQIKSQLVWHAMASTQALTSTNLLTTVRGCTVHCCQQEHGG